MILHWQVIFDTWSNRLLLKLYGGVKLSQFSPKPKAVIVMSAIPVDRSNRGALKTC